jgi:hypothetical protein
MFTWKKSPTPEGYNISLRQGGSKIAKNTFPCAINRVRGTSVPLWPPFCQRRLQGSLAPAPVGWYPEPPKTKSYLSFWRVLGSESWPYVLWVRRYSAAISLERSPPRRAALA